MAIRRTMQIVGFLLSLLFAITLLVVCLHKHPKKITAFGVVTCDAFPNEAKSAKSPARRARVIVSVYEWDPNPLNDQPVHYYALTTDHQGLFRIEQPVNYRVGGLLVQACTVDDQLGHIRVQRSESIDLIEMKTRVRPEFTDARYRYVTFRGSASDHITIQFLDEEW